MCFFIDDRIVFSFLVRFKSLFGLEKPSETEEVATTPQAEINIFTVASGLLYEVNTFHGSCSCIAHPTSALRRHHDSQRAEEY
jgi:hypothetical protein